MVRPDFGEFAVKMSQWEDADQLLTTIKKRYQIYPKFMG